MSDTLLPPCHETASASEQEERTGSTGVLVATVMGSSLAFVVGSIVNVALPAMQRAFALDAAGAQWIVNAYLLPLGALVLLGGALGDHYGRRRAFVGGLGVFLVGCLGCALAPSFATLLAARAVQGVGAALVAPTSLAIISAAFSGKARGRAVGTWAAAGAAAGALAPVAGGWIVDTLNWRWAFGAVVPLAALTLIVALRTVEEGTADEGGHAPLDWLGAGLAVGSLLALIWALIAAPERGWTAPPVLVALIGGGMLLASFLLTEHRKQMGAMMPLALFARPTFSGISLLTLCLYMALGGLLVVLPFMLIQSFGYSATQAGAAILPFPLVMGLLSRFVGGTLADRVGTRAVLTVGSLLVAGGFVLLSFVSPDAPDYWTGILPGLVVVALGMAASVAPLTSAVLASAGDRYSGVASGINNAVSRIAGLIATALLGFALARKGEALVAAFSAAAWGGAVLALGSAAAALLLVRPAKASSRI